MSNLLLVTRLLCEISQEMAHQAGQLVMEGRSGTQSAWLMPDPWAWFCYTELLSRSQLPGLHGWDFQHQRNQPRRGKCWRYLGGLGRGSALLGTSFF